MSEAKKIDDQTLVSSERTKEVSDTRLATDSILKGDIPQSDISSFIENPEDTLAKYTTKKSNNFSYWRDLQFVEGARLAEHDLQENFNEGGQLYQNTYFIVDTGFAHSIAVGGWLKNKGVDIGISLTNASKISGLERAKFWLCSLKDLTKSEGSTSAATLLDAHRDDPSLGNSAENDIKPHNLLPVEYLKEKGIKKIIVFIEMPIGDYNIQNTLGYIKQYLMECETNNIEVIIKGIDLVWTKSKRGLDDSRQYEPYRLAYDKYSQDDLVAKLEK